MDEITTYRNSIVQSLVEATDGAGTPRLTEKQARDLAATLSDGQLAEGMLFNTPEEVARLLLESGLA